MLWSECCATFQPSIFKCCNLCWWLKGKMCLLMQNVASWFLSGLEAVVDVSFNILLQTRKIPYKLSLIKQVITAKTTKSFQKHVSSIQKINSKLFLFFSEQSEQELNIIFVEIPQQKSQHQNVDDSAELRYANNLTCPNFHGILWHVT